MNLSYVQGFIEFYSVDQYPLIEQSITALGERNFFNLTLDRKFANNHGSIIIPFAKSFRSDESDREFLNQHLNSLIKVFIEIGLFSIDVILDLRKNKSTRFNALLGDGCCSISYIFSAFPLIKEKKVAYQKEKEIDFIE